MDTMTTTKIVGAVCGSFLILLLLKWGGEIIFHGGGHGDMEAAYSIEVDEAPETEAEADTGPTFADLLAQADLGKGERAFGKCKACHKLGEGENLTGPSLFEIVGRDRGVTEGFTYSGAMASLGGTWTPEELDAFLTRPRDYVTGTTMTFPGFKKPEDRANVIAYLSSLSE